MNAPHRIVILKTRMETKLPSLLVYLRDVEYEDVTGKGLAQEILNEAQKRNVPPTKMIGFGSDGANVRCGEGKGVNGRLKEQNAHMALLVKIFLWPIYLP